MFAGLRWQTVRCVIIVALATWSAGCDGKVAPPSSPPAPRPPLSANAPAVAPSPDATWYVIKLHGAPIGHSWLHARRGQWEGRDVITTDMQMSMTVARGAAQATTTIAMTTHESLDHRLLGFTTTTHQSDRPTTTTGVVRGGVLEITDGRRIPWDEEIRSPHAWQLLLAEKPLSAGDTRKFRSYDPAVGEVLQETLTAETRETVTLASGSRELLRVRRTQTPNGKPPIRMTAWVDERGAVLLSRFDELGLSEERVPRELALQPPAQGNVDLLIDTQIKLAQPLDRPHQAAAVTYRVQLESGDPAEIFPAAASQFVRRIDARTAEVTALAIRPQTPLPPSLARSLPADPPTDGDRRPSAVVQSDDPRVVALANQGAGEARDPWAVAVALERHLHSTMRSVDFTQAFASAAETAQSLRGDCSEYAVLLAAMCRARGLPARVAAGLVYVPPQSLGYHMWTEVWIADRWLPLDATLGLGGAGGGHLKVATTNLAQGASDVQLLAVVKLLAGKPRVEVVGGNRRSEFGKGESEQAK